MFSEPTCVFIHTVYNGDMATISYLNLPACVSAFEYPKNILETYMFLQLLPNKAAGIRQHIHNHVKVFFEPLL